MPSGIALSSFRILGCAAALYATQVRGEPPAPDGPPLSLGDAVAAALRDNPSLKAFAFEARVAEARIIQAGIRPNPVVSLEAENLLGTGAMSGVKYLETTLQLSQVIDLGDTIDRRVETARDARSLAEVDFTLKRLDLLAEVARRYVEVTADSRRLEAARRARTLAESIVAAVQVRVERAVASPIDLHRARQTLGLRRIEEEHAEHEWLAHRRHLAAAIGRETDDFGTVSAVLDALPEVPDYDSLARRLEASPALGRAEIETRWHEAQLRLAQSLRRAGATVSAGLRRNEATDSVGFVAGLSLPIAVREPNAGDIRAARERRAQTTANAEALRLEMRATLYEVYQEMVHARTVVDLMRDELMPAARATLQLTETGYHEGRFSALDWLDAQQALLDLEQRLITNATAWHLHAIELERLLGAPLAADAS